MAKIRASLPQDRPLPARERELVGQISEPFENARQLRDAAHEQARLIGSPATVADICAKLGWKIDRDWIIPATNEADAGARAVEFVGRGEVDAVMKGNIHTDAFMRGLLDTNAGLRMPGRRVSHVFVTKVPTHPKLLGITDAAINIAPDLPAKAQIVRNAIELFKLIGTELPKVAVLSAVETVNLALASTLDAACLTLMGRRGQISGALVDGPLVFDNTISERAAKEKGIASEVAGDADNVLVPDRVSGNILAKNLEYLAGAVAAGIVIGLAVLVILSSRADPPSARLAAIVLASLIHHRSPRAISAEAVPAESSLHYAPQLESACCPIPR
jgi:phosphotransacetylase